MQTMGDYLDRVTSLLGHADPFKALKGPFGTENHPNGQWQTLRAKLLDTDNVGDVARTVRQHAVELVGLATDGDCFRTEVAFWERILHTMYEVAREMGVEVDPQEFEGSLTTSGQEPLSTGAGDRAPNWFR